MRRSSAPSDPCPPAAPHRGQTRADALRSRWWIDRAGPRDARALIALNRLQFAAAHHLNTRAAEYRPGLWRTMRRLALCQTVPARPVFLARHDRHGLIGALETYHDPRARVRHGLSFVLGVHPRWQRRGVGGALLDTLIGHVRRYPDLERIELHVHSDNDAALALYKSRGFRLEGRRRAAIRRDDGQWVDDLILALWPGAPGGTPPAQGRQTAGTAPAQRGET